MTTFTKAEQLKKNKEPNQKKQRFRKCRYCGEKTVPYGAVQPFCFKRECIQKHNILTKEKANRATKKNLKEADRSYWLKIAQKEVNRYIRIRDKYTPCISCGKPVGYKQEAGHWRSAGNNSALRFYTLNIHSQCHVCNVYKSANSAEYRKSIVEKYGIEKVEWMESQTHPVQHTIEYLRRLITVFRKKIKLYEGRR